MSNGTGLTIESSIKLLAETVKVSLGDYYNERNIGYLLKALDGDQLQFSIVKLVFLVFENSLRFNNADVSWLFVKS